MCGIAGFLYRDASRRASIEELKPMLDRITHRGPDDWGSYLDGPLAIGMRRLSIIDLSTGHQPIHNEDETVWTVFNGEIYNFLELRPDLEAKGHKFYTNTDTEVIVHLWEEYGPEFVHHLRGMFGIAVWDTKKRTLMLVRDRLGIKPLYYCDAPDGVFFGSELKAMLAHPSVPRETDYQAVREYLELQYIPAPRTVLKGVAKLEPGHYALVERGSLQVREYWDAVPDPVEKPLAEYREELEETLMKSVRLRLISDVPLGVFLSGGIDSSTVVALMARQMGEPVKSFSIGFDYEDFDELRYARLIAKHFGTDHHEEIVHPEAIALLPKLVWHYDEPFADSSSIPTYYVCRMARKHVTVALSGDGGDELFGGYTRYLLMRKYERFDRLMGSLRTPLFSVARRLPFSLRHRALLTRLMKPLPDIYRDWMSFFTPTWLESLAPLPPLGGSMPSSDGWRKHWERAKDQAFMARLLYVDMKTYLPDDILTKVDRASMAVSLEARVPILDHKVVELAARIPFRYKINGDMTKFILKDMIRPWMPEGFLKRPKMGFGVPLVEWFRKELKDYVRDRLLSARARQRGLFDMKFVEELIDLHQSGRTNVAALLWALLFLEEWHCQFMGEEVRPSAP